MINSFGRERIPILNSAFIILVPNLAFVIITPKSSMKKDRIMTLRSVTKAKNQVTFGRYQNKIIISDFVSMLRYNNMGYT